MKRSATRSATIAAAAMTILAVGLPGCSSDKPATAGGAKSSKESSVSANSGSGRSGTKVTIDGSDQHVTGTTVCTAMGGTVNIAIGGAATGIAAVLTDANPPSVTSVGLGNVNGVTLAYAAGSGQGSAEATKDGNGYKISGTATGVDTAHPTQMVSKPFEIDVTCS